jgi:hypothetical protein
MTPTYEFNGRIVEAPWRPNVFKGHYGVMWYVSRLGIRCADLEEWNLRAKPVNPRTGVPRATELVSRRIWRAELAARTKARRDAARAKEAAK